MSEQLMLAGLCDWIVVNSRNGTMSPEDEATNFEFLHGLTDTQFAEIGRILMHWSLVEENLTSALARILRVDDKTMIEDLIAPLDLRKKLDLLTNRAKGCSPEFVYLVKEMKRVNEEWKGERNLLAHGISAHSVEPGPGISAKSLQGLRRTEDIKGMETLEQYSRHARYAFNVAVRILIGAGGNPIPPLPQKPS